MAIDLDQPRLQVIAALERAMRGSAARRRDLLGVKGAALERATAANRTLTTSPTSPALERYTGVLYDALDPATLRGLERRRLDRTVLVLSGLWGLVAPCDPLPDHRLKMGASLPGTGRLATWWREPLTDALARRARGRTVWNLLPNEHDAAWRPDLVDARAMVRVRFLDRRPDGSTVAVSHWNKFLKGALVRELVAHPGTTPDDLAGWAHPCGYRLVPALTERHGIEVHLSLVR
jgi:cytoplasmic iron level regulating protein YaaA (DUF328/UPF0246 family)